MIYFTYTPVTGLHRDLYKPTEIQYVGALSHSHRGAEMENVNLPLVG